MFKRTGRRRPSPPIAATALLLGGAVAFALVAWPIAGAEELERGGAAAESSSGSRRFQLKQENGAWSLVSPDGRAFFSRGVCVLDQGAPRAKYDPDRPAYARWRHYDSADAWASASLRRLKSWKFTTVGGWSDFPALNRSAEQSLYLTPVVHLGSTVGFPWYDMWDERHLARMERLATERIDPLRGDARVIGYYSDNEIGWWCATLWKMTLEQPATSGQRRRLVALVRETYDDQWESLVVDFAPSGASSWEELEQGGGLAHRAGGDGIKTMRRFLRLAADRYYELMHDAIRRHDPEALFLGDRYQSFYYPEVAAASARRVDVASTNLNASWNDGRFVRCHLDTLHAITRKPVLVSEFYMAAEENRSGNKNATSGFPTVRSQAERAKGALTTLEALTRVPFVVGADWFQYYDEPPHGRFDGEDYNFGLVDIDDRPYEELTNAFGRLDAAQHRSARRALRPTALAGAPPAPDDPFAELRPMVALKQWDRERGFVPSTSDAPLGDLYVCWSPESLYVGLYAFDPVESLCYEGQPMPNVDRAILTVQAGDSEAFAVRLGGAAPPESSDRRVRVECLSGFDHDFRLIAIVELPARLLGRDGLQAGDAIDLKASLTTHGGVHEFGWEARLPLAD